MKTPYIERSLFLIPNLSSSASPIFAFSIALSKELQPSSGVPVLSFAITNPSWSITKAKGNNWAE